MRGSSSRMPPPCHPRHLVYPTTAARTLSAEALAYTKVDAIDRVVFAS